jgi:ABC-type nitrate/sulfonate/bicarbonate transport system ATPase subunit
MRIQHEVSGIWQSEGTTVVLVAHDIDVRRRAILLCGRIGSRGLMRGLTPT